MFYINGFVRGFFMKKGFTLIELVVTCFVFSLGLLALLKNEVVQQKFDAFLNINEKARYYKKYEL